MSFIVVDGPNGSGKTTLINSLKKNGYNTLSSPNGTPLAQMLRPACRGTEPWEDIDKNVQFLLFSAARMDEYIRLVHNIKDVIVADRWWTSTFVYQCCLQSMSVDYLLHTIHPEEKIDMVIILDADKDVLVERMEKERQNNSEHGKCRWTQDVETVKNIIDIYRHQLPYFLFKREIRHNKIDTTNIGVDEVYDICEKLIKEVKNETCNECA